ARGARRPRRLARARARARDGRPWARHRPRGARARLHPPGLAAAGQARDDRRGPEADRAEAGLTAGLEPRAARALYLKRSSSAALAAAAASRAAGSNAR